MLLRTIIATFVVLLPIVAVRADALQDATSALQRKDYASAVRLLEP
jgi:hypothetical protein